MEVAFDEEPKQLASPASDAQPFLVSGVTASPTIGGSGDANKMVLVEILFKGKKKTVKHKASTKISELLAMYKQRFEANALRVCDKNGVEQGSEMTLGLLQEANLPQGVDSTKSTIQLSLEE